MQAEPKPSVIAIKVEHLGHIYSSFEKGETFRDMIKDFFAREHREICSLQDVSFEVQRGEILGLLGINGAGKTTLLKILSGLLKPKSGKVTVLGQDPYLRDPNYLKRIGFVFGQKSQLNWDLPAYDTFDLLRAIYQIPQKTFEERLDHFVNLLQFGHRLRSPVRKLSLGERMKAELICALIHQPEILFLDEPTIGLDIVSQKVIREFVQKTVREIGVTVILTSHSMADIEHLADKLCVLQKGRVSYFGAPEELKIEGEDQVEIRFVPKGAFTSELLQQLGFKNDVASRWMGFAPSFEVNQKLSQLIQAVQIESLEVSSQSLEDRIFTMFSQESQAGRR